MKYRLTIFDLDGTLASSLDAIVECMTAALATFGFSTPSHGAIRSTVGVTLEESVKRLTGGKVSRTMLPEVVKFYRGLYETKGVPSTRLFEGAAKLLENLPAYGIRSALVSNKGRQALGQLLENLKIWAFFDLALSAEDVKCTKPDPKLFTTHIAPQFPNIAKREVLVIGDTETDIEFAKAAGLASCWATYGYGDPIHCRRLKPDHEIADLNELREILRRE